MGAMRQHNEKSGAPRWALIGRSIRLQQNKTSSFQDAIYAKEASGNVWRSHSIRVLSIHNHEPLGYVLLACEKYMSDQIMILQMVLKLIDRVVCKIMKS